MKAFDSISHQSLLKALENCGIESQCISLLEEAIRGTERDSLNGQGKRHVWDKEGNETGRSFVQLALQHSTPNNTERWRDTPAKDKRHGNMLRWFWVWLPLKPSFCWRRVVVLYIAGAAPKDDVRLQAEYREGRIENPPGQDENSQQPMFKQKKRSEDSQHQRWDFICARECEYLGQTITFQQQETAEIRNRIRAAWASFYRFKQKLTSKSYFLPHRPRLFNMVITPTLS